MPGATFLLASVATRILLQVGVCLLVGATAFEVILRVGFHHRPQSPIIANVVRDDWAGWRSAPNLAGPEETDRFGLRSRQATTIQKPTGTTRVAVLGSSFVFGICSDAAHTVSQGMQDELLVRGVPAEALNFGVSSYSLNNVSANLQNYVYQFHPDAVVVVLDMQSMFIQDAALTPGKNSLGGRVVTLSWTRALLKKAAAHSALLNDIDQRLPTPELPTETADASEAMPNSRPSVERYEAQRRTALRATLGTMAHFARLRGMSFYVVTPFTPHYALGANDAKITPLAGVVPSVEVYGGLQRALDAEMQTISMIAAELQSQGLLTAIDMQGASRALTRAQVESQFCDGIHLAPNEYLRLGRELAQRIRLGGDGKR